MSDVTYEVLLFAGLRERSGRARLEVSVPTGARVTDVLAAVAAALPAIAPALAHCRVAVALEFVGPDHVPSPGDEIAIIPPVSGGHDGARVQLVRGPLSVDAVLAQVRDPEAGGITTFVGQVRRRSHGKTVDHLEYEAYEDMALRVMDAIARRVAAEITGAKVAIAHRLGPVALGEAAVVVAASAPHRAEAFAACRMAIEALKRDVPIWKREVGDDGTQWFGRGP